MQEGPERTRHNFKTNLSTKAMKQITSTLSLLFCASLLTIACGSDETTCKKGDTKCSSDMKTALFCVDNKFIEDKCAAGTMCKTHEMNGEIMSMCMPTEGDSQDNHNNHNHHNHHGHNHG